MDRTSRAERRRHRSTVTTFVVVLFILSACGSPGAATPSVDPDADGTPATQGPEAFDLDALIAAAQAEGELNVLNNSGGVEDAAAAFQEMYGITVNGVKADSAEQTLRVTREVESGNVTIGVIQIEDGPMVAGNLIPQGIVENWVPPDLASSIPSEFQNPLVQQWSARVLSYNSETYETCPITNLWQLTDDEWRGRLALRDPLGTPEQITWFTYLVTDGADALAEAYESHYGEPLETTEENAGYEFVKRLAESDPLRTPSDDEAMEAAGAPGQTEPHMAFLSIAKFVDAEEAGHELAVCTDVDPLIGYAYPRYSLIVSDGPSPNAAKLYVHFSMTEEGVAPWFDEVIATNEQVPLSGELITGLSEREDWDEQLVFLAFEDLNEVWSMRQPMQDFWRLNAG